MSPSPDLRTLQNFRIESDCLDHAVPRAGILDLPRGSVPTPVFMPVGTQATVKGTLPGD